MKNANVAVIENAAVVVAAAVANAAVSVPAVAVGLNDKVHVAAANDAVAKPVDVRGRIEQLVAERKDWQHGAYVKSNEQLYALLGKCYGFYFDLRGNDKETKAAREVLNGEISKKGYSFNEGTHMLTKLVKYVFEGIDRRRVSAYSLVLREALAQNKKADEIAAFITNGGGVEEIRRSKSGNAKTPAQKAALGKQAVAEKQLATFNSDTLAVLAQNAGKSVGDELVAVIAQQADGSFVVRALINSKTALNAALGCAYSANKAVGKNDSAANDDKALDELINDAA
jgi:hypothetical protein